MIYGVIDKDSCRGYTYLKAVFDAIDNKQIEYNWLVTNTEIIAHSDKLDALNTSWNWLYENSNPVAVTAPGYCFLSGEELTKIITDDDSQWIWGVLSGFKKCIPLDEILKYPLPKVDEYEGFWKNPPSIQHPLASVEIVPWDSCLVLVLSKNKAIVDSFRLTFSKSQDLSEYNIMHNSGLDEI